MKIQKISVVGAGQMGAGIAQVAASSGFFVHVTDVTNERLDWGKNYIQKSLQRLVKKDKITSSESDEAFGHIAWSTSLEDHHESDIAIEAATENIELKQKIFRDLDGVVKPDGILASNTSSISITLLSNQTKRCDKVIGMHFMNPVPMMKLVEVIRALQTSDDTYGATLKLAADLGKTTTTSQDYPGFIANRLLMPMINEAFFALMEGLASAEDIDETMKLGMNHPMGPLQLADFVGLDTCLAVCEMLHSGLGDSKYRPCPLLKKYVEAGWLGKKVGRGVYTYEPHQNK